MSSSSNNPQVCQKVTPMKELSSFLTNYNDIGNDLGATGMEHVETIVN
jgi:hypothetical protein